MTFLIGHPHPAFELAYSLGNKSPPEDVKTSKVTTPRVGATAIDGAALRLCTNLARGGLAGAGGIAGIGVIIAAVPAVGPEGRGVGGSSEAPRDNEIDDD